MTVNISSETKIRLDLDFRGIAESTAAVVLRTVGIKRGCEVSVLLLNNRQIREINKEQRGIDAATDVLSFPMIDFETPGKLPRSVKEYKDPATGLILLGDIVISLEKVRSQAKKYGLKTGGGVLLYGPPGTGKTFLARAVAGELNLPFYMITAADIFGKYVGESEKRIRELFQLARKNPLSVIFIDELETIFSKRSDNIHETTRKVISYILQELDGVDQNKNPILLLGATNTPWLIDEAFLRPGRFDILAFVDLPDQPARVQILQTAFKPSELTQESGLLQYIADNTAGYSGADLNGVVSKIQQQAFRRGDQSFTKMLAYEVLLNSPPSPNQEMIARLHRWEASRQGRG